MRNLITGEDGLSILDGTVTGGGLPVSYSVDHPWQSSWLALRPGITTAETTQVKAVVTRLRTLVGKSFALGHLRCWKISAKT